MGELSGSHIVELKDKDGNVVTDDGSNLVELNGSHIVELKDKDGNVVTDDGSNLVELNGSHIVELKQKQGNGAVSKFSAQCFKLQAEIQSYQDKLDLLNVVDSCLED